MAGVGSVVLLDQVLHCVILFGPWRCVRLVRMIIEPHDLPDIFDDCVQGLGMSKLVVVQDNDYVVGW
jgi:hypothetical protein